MGPPCQRRQYDDQNTGYFLGCDLELNTETGEKVGSAADKIGVLIVKLDTVSTRT